METIIHNPVLQKSLMCAAAIDRRRAVIFRGAAAPALALDDVPLPYERARPAAPEPSGAPGGGAPGGQAQSGGAPGSEPAPGDEGVLVHRAEHLGVVVRHHVEDPLAVAHRAALVVQEEAIGRLAGHARYLVLDRRPRVEGPHRDGLLPLAPARGDYDVEVEPGRRWRRRADPGSDVARD